MKCNPASPEGTPGVKNLKVPPPRRQRERIGTNLNSEIVYIKYMKPIWFVLFNDHVVQGTPCTSNPNKRNKLGGRTHLPPNHRDGGRRTHLPTTAPREGRTHLPNSTLARTNQTELSPPGSAEVQRDASTDAPCSTTYREPGGWASERKYSAQR